MNRHRFDAVSLVFGLLAVAVGVAAWAGRLGRLINEPSAAIPLAVGLVGVALIASARQRARTEPEPAPD
jgi:ABC-type transport system involved in cytochrome c biogenesis permease subunit